MGKKFTEYSNFNLSDVNKEVLKDWDAKDLFHKSISEREGNPTFVFFEGPPSANGMPGIHHVMARSIKDIFCRYKTMKGFHVKRKAGWDTHGLPVELGVEKELGITKEDIGKKISVDDYNNACRTNVMKFTKEWTDLTHKMGYWVDLENPYITYDNKYIETLWYLLKDLYKKGYLYKGYTIQPYSPAAGTGLSSHELNQPGCYRDVKDTTVVAQFKMVDPKPEMTQHGTPYFLAWTTTPWTLSSNTALCVGPKIEYVAVQSFNPYTGEPATYVCAKALLNAHFNPKAAEIAFEDYKAGDKLVPFKVVAEYKGTDLVGMKYEQLLPWITPENADQAFRVIPGDYVTTEDGTGIVHIAPTFGADDAKVAKAAGIPPLQLIDKNGNLRPSVDLTGKFYLLSDLDDEYVKTHINVEEYKQFEGRFVKNAYDKNLTDKDETLDVAICMLMKATNKAFKIEKHVHNYPHCWRTDKPVLYYPLDSWFIKSTAARERMIELNKTILWKPESTGTGRFGKWLENLNDWNLSRSRYWGTPLPIWATEDHSEMKCIGSIEELCNEIELAIKAGVMTENPYKGFVAGDYSKENYDKVDLHRPYVDNIVLVSSKGEPMHREPDLIDVWFDSGAMPYAQVHYPFEITDEEFSKVFPADYIAEGVDQTRGWFFTLHAIATMLFDSVAFKNIISNGLVLDKNGNKMSKRLGNAIEPFATIEKYGADAVRWYMISNSQPWDNLKFDIEGVDEVRRKFFGTLYNTYGFFALYANVDGFTGQEEEVALAERPEIDRWIISLLNTLVKDVTEKIDDYDPTPAARMIQDFVCENLSNWYVRLNRKRFWGGGMTQDKLAAYQTLYTCLETVAQLAAPFAPFISERVFCDLNAVSNRHSEGSVHLSSYPKCNDEVIDKSLEEKMEIAQRLSSMVLALRRKVNIKVRQPLSRMMIPLLDASTKDNIEAIKQLVMNEVNVKNIEYIEDTTGIMTKRIKPNFKTLGPRYSKQMKQISALVAAFSQSDIAQLERSEKWSAEIDGVLVEATIEDFEIQTEDIPGWLVASEGKLTVALDITITEELKREGIARELVNRIQNIRKESGFEVTDKITVEIERHEMLEGAIADYGTYIAQQTLAHNVALVDAVQNPTAIEIDETPINIEVRKSDM